MSPPYLESEVDGFVDWCKDEPQYSTIKYETPN